MPPEIFRPQIYPTRGPESIPQLCVFPPFCPYLHNIDAGVEVDRSLGFLAVLFVLVGVEDVRAIGELGQIEESPFEDLQYNKSL